MGDIPRYIVNNIAEAMRNIIENSIIIIDPTIDNPVPTLSNSQREELAEELHIVKQLLTILDGQE